MKKALLYLFVVSFVVLYTQETTAQSPTVSNLSLDASPDGNSTNDELEANYNTNPSVVETASAWYRNGSPLAVLYLPFEGGASNALLDFSGNGNDASTTGYTSSTPVWSMTGGYNGAGAFEFDGNDYLYAGNIMPLNSSYTKTAWVYDTGSGYRNIISSTLQINNNHSFNLHPDNTLHAGHSFGNAIVSDLDPMNQLEWYFVAVTFDYETGEMALYKNAVQVDREIVPDSLRSVVDPGVLIGAKNNLYAWRGTIDEPRIYDHVLTDAQIRNMYFDGNDEILPGETRIEDEWQVRVTPFSTSEVGSTETSNTITLESMSITTPTLTAASADNLTIDDLSVSYTSSGSVVETATAWFRDGTPDALLYFPFEGGPINGLLDYSGNDNHLSRSFDAIRVPRWDSDNGHGSTGSFYFNGNDWLEVEDVFPLNSSYTKSAWVYASSFGDNNIMSSRLHGANNHHLKIDSDGVINAGHSFGSEIVEDATPLISGTWYFVALTFDYTTGLMTLYRDGVQVDQATVPEGLRDVVDASVQIGSMQTVYGWEGYIDDARLHDRVLSVEQIVSLYSTGKNTLVSEETAGGEEWQVHVTSFSSSEIGEQLSSNTLTVHSVLVADIPDQSISEGESFNTIDLDDYLTIYDFVEDDIVWSSTGSSDLVVAIDPVTHIATITVPDADWFGSEDITFIATNPNSDEGSTEVAFTVQNVNDEPEIAELGDQLTNESTPLTGLTVDFTDADPGDTHTITVVSGEGNVVVENLNGNTTGTTYDLVPAPGWFGSAIITVTVTDDGDGPLFDEEVYTLTVGEVNDAPVLSPIADQSADEDNTLSGISVDFTDADAGDTHTIDIASDDANVTAANISGTVSGSTFDLVPAADWNGSAEITVTVTDDGTGTLSDVETFTFTVNPINDAPVITDAGNQQTDENATLSLSVVYTDVDVADTHIVTVVSDEANVSVENLSGSNYDLVPLADWSGTAEITTTVTDNGDGTLSDTETFTLTVNSTNLAPDSVLLSNTAVDERVALETVVGLFSSEDVDLTDTHTYTFILDGGVFDVDNDAFIIVGDTLKTNVNLDFEGQSSYSILVQSDDGEGGTSSQNFTITVNDLDETGVEDIYNNPSFKVYPVPAIDNITVEVDNPDNKELQLEIYSSAGRLVHAEAIYSKSRVDLTGFTDGMYILTIKGEQVFGTRKIIVKDR